MAGMMIMKRFLHALRQYKVLPYFVLFLGLALSIHGYQHTRPVEWSHQGVILALHAHESSGKHVHHPDHVYDHLRHYEQLVNRLLLLRQIAARSALRLSTYSLLMVNDIFKPPRKQHEPSFMNPVF